MLQYNPERLTVSHGMVLDTKGDPIAASAPDCVTVALLHELNLGYPLCQMPANVRLSAGSHRCATLMYVCTPRKGHAKTIYVSTL